MGGRGRPLRALVWRRLDFRESSRLVTLLTREQGKLTALAKGAHRPGSQLLGRIDFLNLLEVTLAGRRGTLPVLTGARLLHEPRALRRPARFLVASYLAEILDRALPEGRADEALFDLLEGGLRLLERCPAEALPQVLAGLEWRFLAALGMRPSLLRCQECDAPLPPGRGAMLHPHGMGLLCPTHGRGRERIEPAARGWLLSLDGTPGRRWPELAPPPSRVRAILGAWIAAALERRPRGRAAAMREISGKGLPAPPLRANDSA